MGDVFTLCSLCRGVGSVERDEFGRHMPASPTWTDTGTSSLRPIGSEECPRCRGSRVEPTRKGAG